MRSRGRARRCHRRQKDAANGECGALLEVQIGDDEKAFFRPKQRTNRVGAKIDA
jgi:hypothetical protein